MNLLVSWIIDHPEAVSEEEARLEQAQQEREADEGQRRQEEQLQQQEADRDAAASEFLSLFGEVSELVAVSEPFWKLIKALVPGQGRLMELLRCLLLHVALCQPRSQASTQLLSLAVQKAWKARERG